MGQNRGNSQKSTTEDTGDTKNMERAILNITLKDKKPTELIRQQTTEDITIWR